MKSLTLHFSSLLPLVAAFFIAGCQRSMIPLIVRAIPGSETIVVAHDSVAIPDTCRLIGHVTEEDGKVDPPGAYNGTAEALDQRFRNDAVKLGGNVALIPLDKPETVLSEVAVDCRTCGMREVVTGSVYHCPIPGIVRTTPTAQHGS
jgi:hypothetical protein